MSGTNTRPATNAVMRNSALRALDDPAQLARAARIVRAALERGALSKQDLDGPIVPAQRDDTLPASVTTDRP
jgi:hypothetical protein